MIPNKVKLNPKKSVNGIVFGKKIDDYTDQFSFDISRSKPDDIPKWDTFTENVSGIEVYVEDSIIVSIASRKTLYLDNVDLMSVPFSELRDVLKTEHTESDEIYLGEEDNPHNVYEFDSFGMQVWEKNNKIDCIICSDGE